MKRLFRLTLLVAALAALWIAPASAHGGREVGDYNIVFGWQVEPAYAGVFNGPEVFIELAHSEGEEGNDHGHDEENFLDGVEVNLTAEVTFGPETITVALEPAWGTIGQYVADLVPTLPGDYIFRITGNIGDTEVDLTFDSADGEFSSVLPSEDILFPSAFSIEARIAALEAQIAELEAALAALAE